jgi:hypothetical protein
MPREQVTYWLCLNRDCGKTLTCEEAERELETRACECGRLMKRETHATVFSYLNFLRETANSGTVEQKGEAETPCESEMWSIQPCGERLRWS